MQDHIVEQHTHAPRGSLQQRRQQSNCVRAYISLRRSHDRADLDALRRT